MKARYVVVPRNQVLITIASQPDCPLRIEEAALLIRVDKPGLLTRYKRRNISSKPVKFFTVVSLGISGSGGTLPLPDYGPEHLLAPGEAFDAMSLDGDFEIVEPTEEIRRKLKGERDMSLKGEMKYLYFLMIDHVYFADDTIYRDQKTLDSLRDYLGKNIKQIPCRHSAHS